MELSFEPELPCRIDPLALRFLFMVKDLFGASGGDPQALVDPEDPLLGTEISAEVLLPVMAFAHSLTIRSGSGFGIVGSPQSSM